jgi:hypothetical protein
MQRVRSFVELAKTDGLPIAAQGQLVHEAPHSFTTLKTITLKHG